MELLTAAQMRAVEEAATESGEVTGLQLMERAGRGAVEAIFDWRPDLSLTVGRALVLCGPGNNGGDGYVVARLLSERGWTVDARQYGPPAQRGDAAANRARWAAIGAVNDWDDRRLAEMVASRSHDLVIDALFGTGLARGLGDDVSELRRAMAEAAPDDGPGRFVAIDLPSGICSDSGANLGRALPADLAVSFHAYKLGHFLRPDGGEGGAGRPSALRLVEIGLDHAPDPTFARLAASPDPRDLAKAASGHKYSHGHALVLAGGVGEGGAARLAARAALRAGAGLVTLGAPPAAIIENAARLDAVMLARIGDAAAL
ncbi:MAG: NAD(P)H-hydrate epimerase, partial [Pseudomonadota bacterium]